jgi:succinate dehydrogenase / fumarate reductase, iron-sulfur subunit
MDLVQDADYCIQCGACYYVCPVVRVNGKFLGPAALTKAYRFAADARDFSSKRLQIVHEQYSGVWDCAKCLLCVEACPKNINPFNKITALHEMGTDRGINAGSEHCRHARIFNRQVRRTGYINEFFLALNTLRLSMITMVLRGLLLVFNGKMRFNFLFPRSVKRYELRDILRKHKAGGGAVRKGGRR